MLKVVIHSPLRLLDPFIVNARNTQMHGYMVYDTLFSLDSKRVPQPQMVKSYDVSADKKTYSFKLRSDVRFHDGAPIRAQDAIVSLQRWGKKDPLGAMLMSSCELSAIDKDSFRLVLTQPFGLVLEALGKPGTLAPFILPARIAGTSADQPIEDATGSGPYLFKKSEWVPGSKSVYVRNPDLGAALRTVGFSRWCQDSEDRAGGVDLLPRRQCRTRCPAKWRDRLFRISTPGFLPDHRQEPGAQGRESRSLGRAGLDPTQSPASALQQPESAPSDELSRRSGRLHARARCAGGHVL
jgi:hypothetical protein